MADAKAGGAQPAGTEQAEAQAADFIMLEANEPAARELYNLPAAADVPGAVDEG